MVLLQYCLQCIASQGEFSVSALLRPDLEVGVLKPDAATGDEMS